MSWQPPPRPAWVQAVNAGDVVPISEYAALPFDRDGLLAEARAHLGVADGGMADFGDERFLEPLDVFVRALEEEARLTVIGRWMTRRYLVRLLEVRLQLAAYVRSDPGVLEEEIVAPLFVTGVPRTGTTILYSVLAQDPRSRVPEGWEFLRPVPPPDSDPHRYAADARIPLADAELRSMALVTGSLDSIHEYSGRMPKECVSPMAFELLSEELTTRYDVPSYTSWFARCDLRPAYEMHRLVLQVLQRRWGGSARWVLKSPVHMHALPVLLDVYPDARIAFTHRDPLTILASVTSLVATLRWAHSDVVDYEAIGRYNATLYKADLDNLVTMSSSGALDPVRVHHGHYASFVSDPAGSVAKLYAHFGLSLDADVEERMRAFLAARPKDKHGTHHYSWDDLGLDAAEERAGVARYQSYFDVPSES